MEEPRGLSCSVCYNAFTSTEDQSVPRNLNCGHTFCTACLQKIAAQSHHVYVKCPACKSETPLFTCNRAMSSISSLPKNFGLLEIIESRERKSIIHASACSSADLGKTKSNNICEEHDEAKKVYCFTDQCLICIYCQIYGKHKGHNCELASKLAKSSREELQKISEKLENECNKLCNARSEITKMENSIANRQYFLKGRVKKYTILLHQYLTKQETRIVSKIDEISASKLQILKTQEKTLCEVIKKYKELYILIQTIQNDGDSSVIEDKPTIEKLVDEMSYLSEACQVQPQAENNLMFEFDKDVLITLNKLSGKIIESEAEEEQIDNGGDDIKEHFLDDALSNLEKEIHHSSTHQLSSTNEHEGSSAGTVETDTEEDDNDDEEEVEEDNQSDSTLSSSEADEVEEAEQEEAGTGENISEEDGNQAEEEEVASEGELLGAVGGNALPEAQQDENKRKDINEKQSLLRELQHEIERLRLLGPTGELIRVIDDSSSSSCETGSDTDDEHDTHSLQLDFQIRVNNDLGRSKPRSTSGAAVQRTVPTKDPSARRKHNNSRSFGRKRCSASNCQHHVQPTLQCKNCSRVFCQRCASLSLTCNKSEYGHNYVTYRHGYHLNKNMKSARRGKVSKSQKTCARGSIRPASHWVCKRCTMINEGHVLVCGACETSKDYDPEESRNICPMCTLVNEPGKTNCELCDTSLEEVE